MIPRDSCYITAVVAGTLSTIYHCTMHSKLCDWSDSSPHPCLSPMLDQLPETTQEPQSVYDEITVAKCDANEQKIVAVHNRAYSGVQLTRSQIIQVEK